MALREVIVAALRKEYPAITNARVNQVTHTVLEAMRPELSQALIRSMAGNNTFTDPEQGNGGRSNTRAKRVADALVDEPAT